jgi:hypothetical protein
MSYPSQYPSQPPSQHTSQHPSYRPSYGPVSGPVIPPNNVRPQGKSNLGLILGISGAAVVLLGAIGGAGAYAYVKSRRPVAFPVDAKVLPAKTNAITTQLIEATRESDPTVKRAYLAAELGAEMCRPGAANPAQRIEEIGGKGPRAAKEFFLDAKVKEETAQLLECGSVLGGTLESPYQALVSYEDEDAKKQNVAVGHFSFSSVPRGQGFVPQAFRGVSGFCRTGDDQSCNEKDYGGFKNDKSWFFGTRESLEGFAPGVRKPKETLGLRVQAMQEAAAQTEGLPVVRIEAEPKTAKSFFNAPCIYGASHSAVSILKFMEGCFPSKSLDKQIEEIDSKIKAAAYETDGDHQKAKAFKGNIVFVARDDRAAKDVEHEVKDIVSEWSAHIDTNEAKLIKDSRDMAFTSREKKFGAVIDAYFDALKKAKVTRKGRTVVVSWREPISAEDLAALDDADSKTREKRQATATIIDALGARKPVPESALSVLVGNSWARYLTAAPSTVRTPMTESECKTLQKKIAWFSSTDKAFADKWEARSMLIQHRFASCATKAPEVDPAQRACLASFHTAAEYAQCAAPGANEPPESDYGDRAKKSGSTL